MSKKNSKFIFCFIAILLISFQKMLLGGPVVKTLFPPSPVCIYKFVPTAKLTFFQDLELLFVVLRYF